MSFFRIDKFVDKQGCPWVEISSNVIVDEDTPDYDEGEELCIGYLHIRLVELPALMEKLSSELSNGNYNLITVDGVH